MISGGANGNPRHVATSIGHQLPDELIEDIFLNLEDIHVDSQTPNRDRDLLSSFDYVMLPRTGGRLVSPSLSAIHTGMHSTRKWISASHPVTQVCSRWRNISLQPRFASSILLHCDYLAAVDFLARYKSDNERLTRWLPTTGRRSLRLEGISFPKVKEALSPRVREVQLAQLRAMQPQLHEYIDRVALLKWTARPFPQQDGFPSHHLSLFVHVNFSDTALRNLRSLTLTLCCDASWWLAGDDSSQITLPSLESLAIKGTWSSFYLRLSCPGLVTIRLDVDNFRIQESDELKDGPDALTFLERFPSIHTLICCKNLLVLWKSHSSFPPLPKLQQLMLTEAQQANDSNLLPLSQLSHIRALYLEHSSLPWGTTNIGREMDGNSFTTVSIAITYIHFNWNLSPETFIWLPKLQSFTLSFHERCNAHRYVIVPEIQEFLRGLMRTHPHSSDDVACGSLYSLELKMVPSKPQVILNIMEAYERRVNGPGVLKLTWLTPKYWKPDLDVRDCDYEGFKDRVQRLADV